MSRPARPASTGYDWFLASLVLAAFLISWEMLLALTAFHGNSTSASELDPALLSPGRSNGFPMGGVHGTVSVQSKIQRRSLAVNLYSRRGGLPITAKSLAAVSEVENVVVYLEGDLKWNPTGDRPKGDESVIRQVDETFVPHTLAIQSGSTVHFPNGDPFFHNVFSLSGARSFDLGRYPKDQVRSVRFDKPGIIKLFCHIHSHMSAVIRVFDHPYFTTADGKGYFALTNLPVGEFTLVVWHERLKPQRKSVRIEPGENLEINLSL